MFELPISTVMSPNRGWWGWLQLTNFVKENMSRKPQHLVTTSLIYGDTSVRLLNLLVVSIWRLLFKALLRHSWSWENHDIWFPVSFSYIMLSSTFFLGQRDLLL